MQQSPRTQEVERASPSGYLWVAIGIALVAAGIFLVVRPMGLPFLALGVVLILLGAFTLAGLYMLQPREAAIMTLFGQYTGTDRAEGLRWATKVPECERRGKRQQGGAGRTGADARERDQLCLVRVRCDEDHAPDFRGELELRDAETGDLVRVTVTPTLLAAYREEVAAHVERARIACQRVGGRLIEAPVERPFEQVLRAVIAPALEQR